MPTYEYLCKSCSHRFETVQKMIDEPLTVCPECGAYIRRVLFPAGIVFKGSGFYKTDHGNGSQPGENGHTPKGDGAEAAKEGESKPAAASESATSSGESKSSESSSGTSSSKTGENKVAVEAK